MSLTKYSYMYNRLKFHRIRIIKTFLFCYVKGSDVKTKAKCKCISYTTAYIHLFMDFYSGCEIIIFISDKNLKKVLSTRSISLKKKKL